MTPLQPASTVKSLPYELRIGVTGHRELADPDGVRRAVRELIERLVNILAEAARHPRGPHGSLRTPGQMVDRYLTKLLSVGTRIVCPAINVLLRIVPTTRNWQIPVVPDANDHPSVESQTPIKLTVITSLAEGSDSIVAGIIHDYLKSPTDPAVIGAGDRNRYVEAVLPMPVGEYARAFSSPAALAAFHELLRLDCAKHQQSPQPTVVCASYPSDGAGGTLEPHDAYRAAGRHVVDTSEIVIAIWDPDRKELPGGTGETARYAVEQGKLVVWLNPQQLQSDFCVLMLGDEAAPSNGAPSGLNSRPLPARAKEISRNFHQLAAFNRDNAVDPEALQADLACQSREFEARSAGKLPDNVRETLRQEILPHVVRANLLSQRYQALRNAAGRLWPTLAAFAVTLMAFQILFLPSAYWLAWVEFAVLLICGISYRVSVHEAWHDKWRNDRRLAEALRTALFSSLVIPDSSSIDGTRVTASRRVENPLPFYNPDQSWFVGTLKRVVAMEHRRCADGIDWTRYLPGVSTFLAEAWLTEQVAYHARNAHKHHDKARRNAVCRLTTIGLIMLVALLHALGIGHTHHPEGSVFVRVDVWIAWATIVLPAWAAALHALTSTEDHDRLAERSTRMAPLLMAQAVRTRAAKSRDELVDCVHQAERLLDLENQEWAESLSERRPEFTG